MAAAMLCGALLVGCADPEEPTDLRSQNSGPPNVTTVTVMTDQISSADPNIPILSRLMETATHCRTGDDKRPGIVGLPNFTTTQVCPDDLAMPSTVEEAAEGAPPSWFARVVFDKLLDPNVEDLVPQLDSMGNPTGVTIGTFVNTQPVTLKCGRAGALVDVPYNGYYVPNGNRVSWPLGPALFVAPLSATSVATGADCEVGIKDIVTNKRGQSVPSDQRTWKFRIAPMAFRFSVPDPADSTNGSFVQDPDTAVQFFWSAALKDLGGGHVMDSAKIKIRKGPNLNITTTTDGDPDPAVCAGTGGTLVAATDIEAVADNATDMDPTKGAASTALIMDLDTAANGNAHLWDPQTTYLITFIDATASPKQGGADGAMPNDYSLCFHTAAPAPM